MNHFVRYQPKVTSVVYEPPLCQDLNITCAKNRESLSALCSAIEYANKTWKIPEVSKRLSRFIRYKKLSNYADRTADQNSSRPLTMFKLERSLSVSTSGSPLLKQSSL